jgi:hypothetical protein
VPGAIAQSVTDTETWFETELPAQLTWHFDTAEARQIAQPVLSVLGGESERLWFYHQHFAPCHHLHKDASRNNAIH